MRPKDFMRLISNIAPDEKGCWIWIGSEHNAGYGCLKLGRKYILAHRILYEMFFGAIPEDKEIDHLCRVRKCVNPFHLEAVSHRENVLRGKSLQAENARKTQCKRGHPLSGDNVVYFKNRPTERQCRICVRIRSERRRSL
jgi:hypothetical protein